MATGCNLAAHTRPVDYDILPAMEEYLTPTQGLATLGFLTFPVSTHQEPPMSNFSPKRRQFLQSTVAAGAALAASQIVRRALPCSVQIRSPRRARLRRTGRS